MCSQNSWQLLHVQSPQPRGDDEVHHSDHAVQLRLVNGDPGVDGVLTLFGLDSIVNTPDNVVRNLFIQVPSYVLRKKLPIEYENEWTSAFVTSNIAFLSSSI